ncbi:hypothetical protein ABZ467_33035 [Streptomyces sp. NPDC005727]
METHPDIVDMRMRHEMAERATSTPQGQAVATLLALAATAAAGKAESRKSRHSGTTAPFTSGR